MKYARRREWLGTKKIECPKCKEYHQIQLTEWLNKPAEWKCRMCSHKWSYEPNAA